MKRIFYQKSIRILQSIRALAMDVGKIQDTVVPPTLKIKPPLDFGDDSDGMENVSDTVAMDRILTWGGLR